MIDNARRQCHIHIWIFFDNWTNKNPKEIIREYKSELMQVRLILQSNRISIKTHSKSVSVSSSVFISLQPSYAAINNWIYTRKLVTPFSVIQVDLIYKRETPFCVIIVCYFLSAPLNWSRSLSRWFPISCYVTQYFSLWK